MSINNVESASCRDVNMAIVKQENTDIDDYNSIFTKLKKLHDIAKTNDKPESGEESQSDDNKLAPKRKPELDFDGLSDDSALNSSTNKTKRRRFSDSQDYSESGDFNVQDYRNTNSSKDQAKYVLRLSNLPGEWTYDQIKQYITTECGVNVLKMTDSRSEKKDYQLCLKFNNEEQYKNVYSKLMQTQMEGKLKVEIEDPSDTESFESDNTVFIGKREIHSNVTIQNTDIDMWDQEGLFGLKPEFLKELNIVPPLGKWINVTNFRCDKTELRDVFEMAGRVVICVILHGVNKCAKIMYSHPLEAVQAISMLNGQTYYGQKLKVTLDPKADFALPLPKGLQSFGVGLGRMGKPLRDVVTEFQRFVTGQRSAIDSSLFRKPVESITESPIDRYSPSKPSISEKFGQFGAIGQRKQKNKQKNRSYLPFDSPRQGPSNVPDSPGLNQQNTAKTHPNPLGAPFLSRASPPQSLRAPILSSPTVEQQKFLGPNMSKFPQQCYDQVGPNFMYTVPNPGQHYPNVPNYQAPPGPNMQGQPMTNYQGQLGPFQGPGPNLAQVGQNFQNLAQFNANNPQFPISNLRPFGPMPNFNGHNPRMAAPIQNMANLGPLPVPAPNTPLPVPAPNTPLPVPAPNGPMQFSTPGPQGPSGLPQGPIGPPQGPIGPPQGPIGPSQGPIGPSQGPIGPSQGPIGPPQGPIGPPQGPIGPPQGPNGSSQVNYGPSQGPYGPNRGPFGPNQGPYGPKQTQRNNSLPSVMVLKGKDPVSLQIINLPEQVTFDSLCGKLSKVGQVVSLKFTTPGCALVQFGSPSEAERCFQYYSPSRYGNELGSPF